MANIDGIHADRIIDGATRFSALIFQEEQAHKTNQFEKDEF